MSRPRRKLGLASRLLMGALGLYRAVLSPWLAPACRFEPSCSRYASEAIEQYGARAGSALAVRRVLRCHPWGGSGYDPVPARGRRGS